MSTPKNSSPLSKGSNRSVVESKSFIAPEKEITMTFAEGPEALLEAQLRLTDQYSNPLEALVRETVPNALDAVIAKTGEGDYAKLPKGSAKSSSKTIENFKKEHLIDLDKTRDKHGKLGRKDLFDKADWERLARSFALADVKKSTGYYPTFEAESYFGKEFTEKYYKGLRDSNKMYSAPGFYEISREDRATILERLIGDKGTPKEVKESAKELLKAINYKGLSAGLSSKEVLIEIEDPEEFKAVMKFLAERKKDKAPVRLKV